jgi:leucyl/phenylalanyl-tRNA--protein transferase
MNDNWEFDKRELLIPENMLLLYIKGAFPMAEEDGEINWYMPQTRAVIPLDNYNLPRSFRKYLEKSDFQFYLDKDPIQIIRNCANRDNTWISEELIEAYSGLLKIGHVHSVEVYEKNKLVGGLYGVTYRGAFFGESMFSKKSQASKAALTKLLEHLSNKKFCLLDVQFLTEHLEMFGAKEISFEEYKLLMRKAYSIDVSF